MSPADLTNSVTHVGQFVSALTKYFVKTSVKTAFMKNPWDKRRYLVEKVHEGSAKAMRDIGFEIERVGYDPKIHEATNFLTVANHLSYIDVFLMAAVHPTLFVTSVDMGETPGLGHVCKMAGCIFVERRNRTTIEKDIEQMTEAMKEGMNVTIFPEGTSSNGDDILPFKKSLLMSAVYAQKDILPLAIKYVELDGAPVTTANRDKIYWYGDDTPFAPHFIDLMKSKNLKVQIHYLPIIKVTPESTRQDLSAQAYTAIRNRFLGLDKPKN